MQMRLAGMIALMLAGGGSFGCETSQIMTVTVYEDPHRRVRLQTFPGVNEGKGFAHPAYLKEEDVKKVLRGVYVEKGHGTMSLPFIGSSKTPERRRAFSHTEIEFFAPLIVKGLAQATPEEVVTFFETAEISDLHEITTSGGIFIEGDVFYVLISNHSTKTQIWQDNEQYQAPYRLRPLEPIDPQPGRLVFDPPNLMIEVKRGFLEQAMRGEPWQVGVKYKNLK